MSKLNAFFDGVFWINLPSRRDRLLQMTSQLMSSRIRAERVSAIWGNPFGLNVFSDSLRKKPGHIGCILSHIKVLRLAQSRNLRRVCIFEDDVLFESNFQVKFSEGLSSLPPDWDLFYMGGSKAKRKERPEYINLPPYKFHPCKTNLTTHAYAVDMRIADLLCEKLSEMKAPIDLCYDSLLPDIKAFILNPYLCRQRQSWSDIQGRATPLKKET